VPQDGQVLISASRREVPTKPATAETTVFARFLVMIYAECATSVAHSTSRQRVLDKTFRNYYHNRNLANWTLPYIFACMRAFATVQAH
jgi:hypothetical protein